MDIPDGDLVRLARDGDPAAFRLLVERHLPMARARAARLCPQPDDADDAVQDAFLQAFIALDRLRDPSRFAGWLGGIIVNVCRAQRRRAPLTLLGDWPEKLHPASAGGLPSAEDLDRADALSRAVAGLPPGQRHAVTAFYYADQPESRIAGTTGAAKASLHKARRRLREYITAHRPDLIPATSRRTPMTAVRIAHAGPWPDRQPVGLAVLADDAGHRALPVRLPDHGVFWRLLARPGDAGHPVDDAGEMTGQLLQAAGITVTAVTVTDLGPAVTATRIDIAAPGGTRQVTTRLADGLALAVITGAPLAVDDPVMDRLAEPVTGPDLPSAFRSRRLPPSPPPGNTRFEPRNLAFTHGLDRWQFDGTFLHQVTGSHDRDYSCTTEDGRVILAAAVPGPAGFAVLSQEIEAEDYHDRTVTFRGHLRATDVAGRAGLVLRVPRQGRLGQQRPDGRDPLHDPENYFAFVTGTGDWARHEVTAQIPPDANSIIFGVFLNGGGRIELRNPQLEPAADG
jgi:RNA polymerase sigma-70 factor (ECF subfamily)